MIFISRFLRHQPKRPFATLVTTSLCLLLFAVSAIPSKANATEIISGFDDVLRQAEVQNLFGATLKIFATDQGFAGMPKLYEAMLSTSQDPKAFTIISGISHYYESKAERLLRDENYPEHALHFRNWLTEWSIADFKKREIAKTLALKPNKKFVFIFDNSDPSFEITKRLRAEFPSQIQAIYLRQTANRPIPDGVTPFYTALDIALAEFAEGRMTKDQALEVARSLSTEKDFSRVILQYAFCPTNHPPPATKNLKVSAASIDEEYETFAARINHECRARVPNLGPN